MSATRRLYRSRTNRAIWGVCGGVGDYFDVDPAFVRVAFVLLAFANGIGIIAYLVLAIAVPKEPETGQAVEKRPTEVMRENIQEARQAVAEFVRKPENAEPSVPQPLHGDVGGEAQAAMEAQGRNRFLVGTVLVILGILFLMGNFGLFWWLSWGRLWPLILIGVGLVIIWSRGRR